MALRELASRRFGSTNHTLMQLPQTIDAHRSYKAYLDDFAAYCGELGGTTAEVMTDLLAFEVRWVLWGHAAAVGWCSTVV